jgi:hypothetical protein
LPVDLMGGNLKVASIDKICIDIKTCIDVDKICIDIKTYIEKKKSSKLRVLITKFKPA